MIKISEEIGKVAKENGIALTVINEEEAEEILNCIRQKYIKSNKTPFLWEGLKDFSMINDKRGWSYIKDFIRDTCCLMFFNSSDDKAVLKLNNGMDLNKILYETYGFEFYLTNMGTRYLIGFNHHDCLFGCGTAKEWILELQR